MSHFCFGAYTRILLSCAPKNIKNKFLCGTLLLGIDENYDIRKEDATVSHLLSGSQNLAPQIINSASKISPNKLETYFEKEIVHRLDENKKANAILALKDLIKNDCSILGTTQLGTLSNKTKDDFVNSIDIPFTEILTDLLLYTVLKTDNTLCKKETQKINRNFCDQYDNQRSTVNIYELPQIRPVQVVPLTVRGKKFDKVFTPVAKEALALSNSHDFQIYRLAIENNEFCYDELGKFLLNNLGNYVFSRTQIQEIIDDDEIATIALQAIRLMNETGAPGAKGSGNELGELLLYVFLEQVLRAPKLMSKVELSTTMLHKRSKSDNIHLLSFESGLNNQLVFGASYVDGDLQIAIDEAFKHVLEIKNAQTNEISLVESTIFYQAFQPEVSALVKDIIIPHKGKCERPDKSFGIFLGYSLEKDDTPCSNDEYRVKAIARMERDIADNVQYIQDKIRTLGLTNFSFYIYVLPFNDALCDKQNIMDNLLTLGSGC